MFQQREIALTKTKTATSHGCRTVDKSSASPPVKQVPMSKPPGSPTTIEDLPGQLHRDTQGSLSPMERFVKLNPANDPSPWETKKVLNELGFQEGHGDDFDCRLNEAAIAAVDTSLQKAGGKSIFAVPGSL
jgi:hypothetical protein